MKRHLEANYARLHLSLDLFISVFTGVPITAVSGHLDSPIRSSSFPGRGRPTHSSSSLQCRRCSLARPPADGGLPGSGRCASPEPLILQLKEKNIFGQELNPLLELGTESLHTHLEEGGSQYVGHLKFETVSVSLLSSDPVEPVFHKRGCVDA